MTALLAMFHDDDCGEFLDEHGRCPKCGFLPDMQSTGFRSLDAAGALAGRVFLGQGRVTFRAGRLIDGPCAFVRCLETGPHRHPVCGACGAVDFGNPFQCGECRRAFKRRYPESTFFPEEEP